jgi:hypothetical protein
MKPSEVLAAARELLAVPGAWWDGSAGEPVESSICASTALTDATHGDVAGSVLHSARGYLQVAIGRDAEDGPEVIYTWNDKPGRTLGEVLAAYDRAIALAEIDEMVTEVCA